MVRTLQASPERKGALGRAVPIEAGKGGLTPRPRHRELSSAMCAHSLAGLIPGRCDSRRNRIGVSDPATQSR